MTALQASPGTGTTAILVEQRFPLGLSTTIDSIRSLYEQAKVGRWDPYRDVVWDDLRASAFDEATRDAARRVWSRRAWTEYTGLAETPALLVRFCLEMGREADPKYFLTVRNTEEAWHIECFHQIAENLGGYLDRPVNPAWEAVFNQHRYRLALDGRQPLDPYVAVHCAMEDGLEFDLSTLYRQHSRHPVVATVMEKITQAKQRHATFGWLYLENRAAQMDATARTAVAEHIGRWIGEVLWKGYHVPTLATEIDTAQDREDRRLLAQAGLGAAVAADEEAVLLDWLTRSRQRLGELDIELPLMRHDRLGLV
ncbi:hypothetical protein [Hydrogenophaga sp. BPS33]|uniref:hypothetical protein n=1 Tax=Hydrogenophaga sp. BPS33 TaxID=2651974 RepID=UPI0013204849|nr:hypothetical protein [Hydrogenophaga sp. BPS33]QHE88648.1 hypothetical protein F9K07_29070 [Hydrogenophaga sp. BPS33]